MKELTDKAKNCLEDYIAAAKVFCGESPYSYVLSVSQKHVDIAKILQNIEIDFKSKGESIWEKELKNDK